MQHHEGVTEQRFRLRVFRSLECVDIFQVLSEQRVLKARGSIGAE